MRKQRARRRKGEPHILESRREDEEANPGKMKPPNHLVSAWGSGKNPYPLLLIQAPNAEGRNQPIFSDSRYGDAYMDYWLAESPPTWMDPQLFCCMALQDPQVREQLQAMAGRGSRRTAKVLEPLLDNVFENAYLGYLFLKFAAARPYVAEWLVAHWEEKTELEEAKEGRCRERRVESRRKRAEAEKET